MFNSFVRKELLSLVKCFHNYKLVVKRLNHNHLNTYCAEKLQNRHILRVSGESCSEFLQGLITNDMRLLEDASVNSLYAMFLNNRGRILYDTIIFRTHENNLFLIECDSSCSKQLMKHLNLYKVRRKIDIKLESELSVWAIYNTHLIDECAKGKLPDGFQNDYKFDTNSLNESAIVVGDPRVPALGYRTILQNDKSITNLSNGNLYKQCRYKLGIGEGVDELEPGQNFTLEMNCDFLNGVSFDKGCYIGQELTARTFHTGVVRKRLMPLVFDMELSGIPCQTPIDDEVPRKSPLGKLKSHCGKYGLGLMRVSETLSSQSLKILNNNVQAFIPYWWPSDIIKQKYMTLNK